MNSACMSVISEIDHPQICFISANLLIYSPARFSNRLLFTDQLWLSFDELEK